MTVMAARIAGAQLLLLPGARHGYAEEMRAAAEHAAHELHEAESHLKQISQH
jgi:hypothetical protein